MRASVTLGETALIIAMDGTVASGKGTLSRRLAGYFGLAHLDTGMLYRAVGVAALKRGVALTDGERLGDIAATLDLSEFGDADLRTRQAGEAASQVAVQPHVRAALLEFQRAFARRPGGAILDGRDIGTVVCPDADVKFWVDAALPVRAQRRWQELRVGQPELLLSDVEADLTRRDGRDRERTIAPMTRASDAHLLDTTELTIDAAVEKACRLVEQTLASLS